MGQQTPWSLPCLPGLSEPAPARLGDSSHPAVSPPPSFRGRDSCPAAGRLQGGGGGGERKRGGRGASLGCTLRLPPLQAPPDTVRRASAALAVPVPRPQRRRHPARASQAAGGGGDHRHDGTRALVRPQLSGARLPNPLRTRGLAREPVGGGGRMCHRAPARPAWAVTGHRLPGVRPGGQRRGAEPARGVRRLHHRAQPGVHHSGAGLRWRPAASQYSAAGHRSLPPGPDATHPALPHAAAGLPQPRLRPCARSPALTGSGSLSVHRQCGGGGPGVWKDPSAYCFLEACAPWAHVALAELGSSAPGTSCLPFLLLLFPEKLRVTLPGTLCWFFRSRCPSAPDRIELCQPLLSCWKRDLQVISVKFPQGQALAKVLQLRDRLQRILSPAPCSTHPDRPPPPGPLPVDS